METPAEPVELTSQQRYRQSMKCKISRDKYYQTKGKITAHEYYIANRDRILTRSKDRYAQLKGNAVPENDLT